MIPNKRIAKKSLPKTKSKTYQAIAESTMNPVIIGNDPDIFLLYSQKNSDYKKKFLTFDNGLNDDAHLIDKWIGRNNAARKPDISDGKLPDLVKYYSLGSYMYKNPPIINQLFDFNNSSKPLVCGIYDVATNFTLKYTNSFIHHVYLKNYYNTAFYFVGVWGSVFCIPCLDHVSIHTTTISTYHVERQQNNELNSANVFQEFNAAKNKYINELPKNTKDNTVPMMSFRTGFVYDKKKLKDKLRNLFKSYGKDYKTSSKEIFQSVAWVSNIYIDDARELLLINSAHSVDMFNLFKRLFSKDPITRSRMIVKFCRMIYMANSDNWEYRKYTLRLRQTGKDTIISFKNRLIQAVANTKKKEIVTFDQIYDRAVADVSNVLKDKTKIIQLTGPIEYWFILNAYLYMQTNFGENPQPDILKWRYSKNPDNMVKYYKEGMKVFFDEIFYSMDYIRYRKYLDANHVVRITDQNILHDFPNANVKEYMMKLFKQIPIVKINPALGLMLAKNFFKIHGKLE